MVMFLDEKETIANSLLTLERSIGKLYHQFDDELGKVNNKNDYWVCYYKDETGFLDDETLCIFDSHDKAYEYFKRTALEIMKDCEDFMNITDISEDCFKSDKTNNKVLESSILSALFLIDKCDEYLYNNKDCGVSKHRNSYQVRCGYEECMMKKVNLNHNPYNNG